MVDCIPNFIPGPAGCLMATLNENKSRVAAGGTLFRSVAVGPDTNNIAVECIWLVCVDETVTCPITGGNVRQYVSGTDNFCDVVAFEVIVYDSNVEVERHRIAQTVDCGSPITWTTGITELRTTLSTVSLYVILPEIDKQSTGTGGTNSDYWDASLDDADHLIEFGKTSLVGGNGVDNNPSQGYLDSIRTGPAFSLVNIGESEILNSDGSVSTLNQPKYWNGVTWEAMNSTNIPTGSPPCAG